MSPISRVFYDSRNLRETGSADPKVSAYDATASGDCRRDECCTLLGTD